MMVKSTLNIRRGFLLFYLPHPGALEVFVLPALVEADIRKLYYPGNVNPVLENVHLAIEAGEFVVITGAVASGKSSLCHCLTGAVPHFFSAHLEGQVNIAGKALHDLSLPHIAGLVGYMMQDPQNQIFSVSVQEDVAFGPGNLGLPRHEVLDRVNEALEFVGLQGFGERSPETLSGGEAQRAVLAGVLALKPQLLVLDQPAAELDPSGKKEIYSRLGTLNRDAKTTVIIVTSHPREVAQYATRYLVMSDGRIVEECLTLPQQFRGYDTFQKRSGRRGQVLPPVRSPVKETVVFENSTYIYPDGQLGCREINLELHQGEMVALLGLNGSGKTTLARHINALVRPTKGSIRVLSRDLQETQPEVIRQKVGFLFQNPDYQIFAGSVGEEAGFSLKIRKVPLPETKKRVAEVLEAVGLLPYIDIHPHRLSRGQRQLLALASILVSDPDIVIADEPTAGLDRSISIRIMNLLSDLASRGKTVLLVTHDLELAATYANRLVAMHEHRIVSDLYTFELPDYLEKLSTIGLDFGFTQPDSDLIKAIG